MLPMQRHWPPQLRRVLPQYRLAGAQQERALHVIIIIREGYHEGYHDEGGTGKEAVYSERTLLQLSLLSVRSTAVSSRTASVQDRGSGISSLHRIWRRVCRIMGLLRGSCGVEGVAGVVTSPGLLRESRGFDLAYSIAWPYCTAMQTREDLHHLHLHPPLMQ